MTWKPFGGNDAEVKPEDKPSDKPNNEGKPPEKPIAEQIAESLRPFTDGMTKLNERLDVMEQNAVRRPEVKNEPAERPSVFDDEDAAFNQRLTPIMLRQLETEARMVYNDIKQEYSRAGYGDLMEQFSKEIEQILSETNVVTQRLNTKTGQPETILLRGNPEYIRNTIDMVMGRAARKAGMRFDGKSKGFFLESAGGGDGSVRPPENDGLSEGQRKVFTRMKVPIEDAKKVMSKLHFVS